MQVPRSQVEIHSSSCCGPRGTYMDSGLRRPSSVVFPGLDLGLPWLSELMNPCTNYTFP